MCFDRLLKDGQVAVLQEQQRSHVRLGFFDGTDQFKPGALLQQLCTNDQAGAFLQKQLEAFFKRGAGADQMFGHEAIPLVSASFGTDPERGEQPAVAAEQHPFRSDQMVDSVLMGSLGEVGVYSVHPQAGGCRCVSAETLVSQLGLGQ